MILEKIVIVRHGMYDSAGLTKEGGRQIVHLAEALAIRLQGQTIALLSSTAKRARETSLILEAALEIKVFEAHESLRPDSPTLTANQIQEVIQLINRKGNDHNVVILSTHMEFVDLFPTAYGKTIGYQIPEEQEFPKGGARIINVLTGMWEDIIPPFRY